METYVGPKEHPIIHSICSYKKRSYTTSEILKVKKRFGYPPDLEETPLVNFFKLRNSKFLVFG